MSFPRSSDLRHNRVQEYDVVVIGGGPVGENAADRASRTGLEVALIEAELVGGECSYWACVPSKALLRSGAALAAARNVPGVVASPRLNPVPVLDRRDWMVSNWDDSAQVDWANGAGITVVRGTARFVGERILEVQTSQAPGVGQNHHDNREDPEPILIVARRAVVVATGSLPVLPDVPGLTAVNPWNSRNATAVAEVPESIAIMGGGVVAVEMATALNDLGSAVTVLSRGRLLGRFEPWAGQAVHDGLAAAGIDVRTGVDVTRAERRPDGSVVVMIGEATTLVAKELLVATGRVPRTIDLGVEMLGLEAGKPLVVDDAMRVRHVLGDWLYAAGDVTGRAATTHQGKYQARVAGDLIAARFGLDDLGSPTAGDPPPEVDQRLVPWSRYTATADLHAAPQVVFSRPELAAVGVTEAEARKAGHNIQVLRCGFDTVTASSILGEKYDGAAQLVVDRDTRMVLGATFVGPDAGELLHAATIAIVGQVPLDRLWHAVPAFPTLSEIWLRLLEKAGM